MPTSLLRIHGQNFYVVWRVCTQNGVSRKVVCVLLELGLTYESVYLEFENNGTKIPEHIKYNPNGRVPTLIDHHAGDFVVW